LTRNATHTHTHRHTDTHEHTHIQASALLKEVGIDPKRDLGHAFSKVLCIVTLYSKCTLLLLYFTTLLYYTTHYTVILHSDSA
jgi:hypothetical protein